VADCAGVLVAVSHIPDTQLFKGIIDHGVLPSLWGRF
jgi:hypothetical protein